jgi:hypothetical protein
LHRPRDHSSCCFTRRWPGLNPLTFDAGCQLKLAASLAIIVVQAKSTSEGLFSLLLCRFIYYGLNRQWSTACTRWLFCAHVDLWRAHIGVCHANPFACLLGVGALIALLFCT